MKLFPFSIFKVSGSSMLPNFKPEQRVITFNWFYKSKVGDVVVAKWGQKLIIKRISEVKNNSIFLKGDSIESTSPKKLGHFKRQDIIGKVIYSY